MSTITLSKTSDTPSRVFGQVEKVPVVLVAHAFVGTVTVDRYLVGTSFTVGRSSKVALTILDNKTSKKHARIFRTEDGFWIEDLGSTNGTFVDGFPVEKKKRLLHDASVIRVGRAVLVFHDDAGALFEPNPVERIGMAGRFHIGPLVRTLREAALSKRHILLTGPSGSGKEAAANGIAQMSGHKGNSLSIIAFNAAGFASAEEATTTLLGVGARVFSGVDARPGLVERANGGVLFLDEVHNLEERVQRSLLRIIEGGGVTRVGETQERTVDVAFIFASNAPPPNHGLAHDLLARLRVVDIPSLGDRIADIPSIFNVVLKDALQRHFVEVEGVMNLLGGDHYEALCLDGFETGNVRELLDLADRLATRVAAGVDPKKAVASIFAEQFSDGAVAARYSDKPYDKENASHYERHKKQIVAVFTECDGNYSATERLLRSRGVQCSRRWLKTYLARWGLVD